MTVSISAGRYLVVILAGILLLMLPVGGVAAQLQPVDIDVNLNSGQTHRLADIQLIPSSPPARTAS